MFFADRMKKIIFNKFGIQVRRVERKVVSLKTKKQPIGDVLLSYVIDPFFLDNKKNVSNSHTNYWESICIAEVFLDLGFNVDVVNYDDNYFVPEKKYSIFIGSRVNFERIANLLNNDCKKIVHLTVAHWLFHNKSQLDRIARVKNKKNVVLTPKKTVEVNNAIEVADCATILGNKFTIGTYKYAMKKMYQIPISTPVLYPWQENKNFSTCRKNFIWFGSNGLVHKGLDLVLDAFSEMPEYTLTVCGPVSGEPDFERAYCEELYRTPNIKSVGWTDIGSEKFKEITLNSIGLVYPSCSEGQSGGVVTCLHAALIPIVSYESGVDIAQDVGILLRDCSVAEIKKSVKAIAELPPERLEFMARNAWEYARRTYTKELFSEAFRQTILLNM